MPRSRPHIALLSASCALLGGCSVQTRPEPVVAYTEITSAPVESHPYVVYEGRPTYFVDERWVYLERGRWVYFEPEPPALQRQRPNVRSPAARGPVPANAP